MAVMDVWCMRLRMRHRSMLLRMRVVLPPVSVEAVFMLMVFVVNVFVGVLQQRIEDALMHIKLPVLRTPANKSAAAPQRATRQ